MKTYLFQSCGHCWVFHICWHIGCSTFPASSFRIWNSSTGIPSPPLALFVVMLPKAHLTSHSRMSGSRWVITPSWLSGSWRSFLCSSSVCSCEFFLFRLSTGGASGKEPACQCGRQKRHRFDPWFGKIPWRRKWSPTPVFLPGESHDKRNLVGYRPWGCRVGLV